MESTKQIKIEIRNRWTGSVVFECTKERNTIAKTVLEAIRLGADLRGADLRGAKGCYLSCPTEGSFIGWKKASGHIVKLRIPEDARRSSATGDKCRCDKAYVMEIQNMEGTRATVDTVRSNYDPNFVYTVGATVEVSDFDDNRWSECAQGIHFFIDRRAAVEY
mgnify:CR=1 FL=1